MSDKTFRCECIISPFSTEKALKIRPLEHDEWIWVPLSQITEIHGRRPSEEAQGLVVMTDWIARKKGLC